MLDADPRRDLAVLRTPRYVILRGRVVEIGASKVTPTGVDGADTP